MPELLTTEHEVARDGLVLENAAFVVNIGDERIQSARTLHQPGFDLRPCLRGDNSRHRVEGKYAFFSIFIAVDVEGHAHRLEHSMSAFAGFSQPPGLHREQVAGHANAFGPRMALGVEHLVHRLPAGGECLKTGQRTACALCIHCA